MHTTTTFPRNVLGVEIRTEGEARQMLADCERMLAVGRDAYHAIELCGAAEMRDVLQHLLADGETI